MCLYFSKENSEAANTIGIGDIENVNLWYDICQPMISSNLMKTLHWKKKNECIFGTRDIIVCQTSIDEPKSFEIVWAYSTSAQRCLKGKRL